jgi:hypothetical protein
LLKDRPCPLHLFFSKKSLHLPCFLSENRRKRENVRGGGSFFWGNQGSQTPILH